MASLLSKTDFKVAHDCPTKLFYKKKKYPNRKDYDLYLKHLARGGYMVGKLATLHYPDGIEIETGTDYEKAVRITKNYLTTENITLFEAAIESNGKIIRIDILEKKGNVINLIEVKSKSFKSTNDPSEYKKRLKKLDDCILDVAYQYYVLREVYPEFNVIPFLFLPDQSKNTMIEGLTCLFEIEEVIIAGINFRKYHIDFIGDIEEILKDDLMTLVEVGKEVIELQPEIISESKIFMESLKGDIKKIEQQISKECFNCEFTLTNEEFNSSGYDECWKALPKVDHHIKDLYYIGAIGGHKNPLANDLINKGAVDLLEFPSDRLPAGVRAERQKIQIEYTRNENEWISGNLKDELSSWKYPLYFIDFETTMSALPMCKGMRPYEILNFQWSCHILEAPSSVSTHKEWINLNPEFPSFKFAESLMETIGTNGTPLMWSHYENTMLKNIYEQCSKYSYNNPTLMVWLEYMIGLDGKGKSAFIDMNKITLDNYFHPDMKGKTSIKNTFPAILKASNSETIESLLANFETNLSLFARDKNGGIINPYELLPPLDIYETAEIINDGTGAMRTYEDIMFGLRKGNPIELEKYRKALLRYCKLDTLAMLIIFLYWQSK